MIRGRLRWAAAALVLSVAASGLCFSLRAANPGAADPPAASARAASLANAAAAADAAVAALASRVAAAVDEARQGAALAVAGSDPPAPRLEAAADKLALELGTADVAQSAMSTLVGVAAAVDPALRLPVLAADRSALASIVTQLRESAAAATIFVERRRATETVLRALRGALAALERHDPKAALDRVAEARAALATLIGWEPPPAALVIWLGTTGELVDATAAIAAATISGDVGALDAAGRQYADASAAARQADAALAIALAEGGAATTSLPLRRMAELLASAAEVRAALAILLANR